MADQEDLDITVLRENFLKSDPYKGDLAPGTAISEMMIDPVTGLPPRGLWEAEMRQYYEFVRRVGGNFAIAMLDLDDFKKINDERGHQAGDAILREFGQAVQARFRAADIKGRYGGDEVIVLMTGFNLNEEELEEEERKIAREIEEKIGSGVSLGIAKWNGVETLEDLIKRADERLYQIKRKRKGNG